jgi:hypothetical protein
MATKIRLSPSGPQLPETPIPDVFPVPIVWRPDGQGDAKTWDEVMALLTEAGAPVQIFCPQPSSGVPPSLVYVIPPGAGQSVTYEMGQSWITGPLGPHDSIQIQLQRGATLRGLAGLSGGIRLQANKQTGDPAGIVPVPVTPGVASVFAVERGASLTNLSNAQEPIISTVTGTESYISFTELGTVESKSGGAEVVRLVSQSLLHVVALAGGLSLDTFQSPGWIAGPADSQLEWMHDGSMAMAANFWTQNANLLSVQLNTPVGNVGGSGPTSKRPVFQGGGPPSVGCMYLDTSLGANGGLPIWWTGTNWVDATGAPV